MKKNILLILLTIVFNCCSYYKAERLLKTPSIINTTNSDEQYEEDNEYVGVENNFSENLRVSVSASSTFPTGFEMLQFNDGDTDKSKREQAKTTYVFSPKIKFKTVKSFLDFLNKNGASDSIMNNKNISNKDPRLPQESVFITIEKAYLYSFSIEEDNDIHLIFGDKKTKLDMAYTMNGEIAGLPVLFKKDEQQILKTRKKVMDLLKQYQKCSGKTQQPLFVPIKISGSIFYDTGHKTKHAKCGCCSASSTAWEIHPIFDMVILKQ
jgi:hypothetical protein